MWIKPFNDLQKARRLAIVRKYNERFRRNDQNAVSVFSQSNMLPPRWAECYGDAEAMALLPSFCQHQGRRFPHSLLVCGEAAARSGRRVV